MEKNYQKAKFTDIMKYSCGGMGSNFAFLLVSSYLMFFYTDVFGISSMAVASLMLISRLIDALTDPMMGLIADNTRSKMGRYRPYIILGAPILGLLCFLLFTAPDLTATMKLVYVYVVYIAYSLISTVVNIPYHALRPGFSKDPQQRTVISVCGSCFSTVAQGMILVLVMPIVNAFGGGKQGWATCGALVGIAVTASFWICAWGSKKYDKVVETKSQFDLKKSLSVAVQNKPMLMLMIAFGTDILAQAGVTAVNVYYFKYVLEREDLVPMASLALIIGGILSLPCIPLLSKTLGKKRTYWLGSLCSILPITYLWINPFSTMPVLIGLTFLFGFFSKIPGTLGWAMVPECVDYGEWKCGIRGDGLLSSLLTFINKLGMAIGASAASFLLGVVGYVANQEQPAIVIDVIVFLRFGMPVFGYLVSLISMCFYEITNEKYAQIREALDSRNTK